MSILNKFRFALCLGFIAVFLSLVGCDGCNNSGQDQTVLPPPPPPTPCPCPQPFISFFEAGGFNVNPGTLPNATSIMVLVADALGTTIDTLEMSPGQDTALAYDLGTVARPLQLRFVYKSSTGEIIGESCLKVDDSGGNGIVVPDVDVVMGYTSSPTPSCSSLSNIQVGSGTGQASFTWDPDTLYEVRFNPPSGTAKKLRLKTIDLPSNLPGITRVYDAIGYGCLDSLAMVNPSQGAFTNSKVLKVSVASQDDCTISGTDNNKENSPRQINVVGPTGWTITVWK